ncbi:MAG: ATP-binding protein [Bacteroidales bacterium]|jgi:predicted AAA+ superfamily ATPase|nr:ATP-binding protein [Bacteroidales bacterium]
MNIDRDIISKLLVWKNKDDRMPLILQGARQIGKTWALQEFGKRYFKHIAVFNFDKTEELNRLFDETKDVQRLLEQLQFYTKVPIIADETLLIFDEIQECNKALNCLKYFCEDAPQYYIVSAGSLLGVALSKGDSFPVGKVEFLNMFPVSFKEFLFMAAPDLHNFVDNITKIEPLPLIIYNQLKEYFLQYQVIGGMPKAVSDFFNNKGLEKVEDDLQNVLNAYSLDFAKHAATKDIPKIIAIWNSIPSQLSKENRKFIYKLVKPGARAREYEDALLWLNQAGLIYRIFANNKPHFPLTAYDDITAFKIYVADTGILRKLSKLPPEVLLNKSPLFTEFKGGMTENIVLQSLITQFDTPRYWTTDTNGKSEVDFIIQVKDQIIPIEVKTDDNVAGKSLGIYNERYKPQTRIRFSSKNLKIDGNLINIPLCLADWTHKLISVCL